MNNKMGIGSDKASEGACHSTNDGVHHSHLANGVVGHHDNGGGASHPPGKKMGPDGDGDEAPGQAQR